MVSDRRRTVCYDYLVGIKRMSIIAFENFRSLSMIFGIREMEVKFSSSPNEEGIVSPSRNSS